MPPLRRGSRRDPRPAGRASAVRASRGGHRARRGSPCGLPRANPGDRGGRCGGLGARPRPPTRWRARLPVRPRARRYPGGDERGSSQPSDDLAATLEAGRDGAAGLGDGERLSLGVAARLSRYLQVLIQARKMGKETISSQELSAYTHINSTQIRRDLSGFGKFGKRGVGYRVDFLVEEIRKILRTSGQHNIVAVRRRQPRPGDRELGHLRRPRLSDRRHLRRRPGAGRTGSSATSRCATSRSCERRRGGGRRRRRPRGAFERRSGGRRPPRRGRGEDRLQLLRTAAPGAARR